jgi:hypothetical protein
MTSFMNPPSLILSIQDEVEKDCKVVRAAKHARTKKTFEKFLAIQKDLQQTISEVRLNPIKNVERNEKPRANLINKMYNQMKNRESVL